VASLARIPNTNRGPLTLHERMPWLVYVVLGNQNERDACDLANLAWQAVRRHDATAAAESQPT